MIFYELYQDNRENGTKLFYARPVHTETVDLDALAKHMSDHNSPYSRGVIRGVLTDMCACIKELLLESKKVKLADLAIFSLGISSRGAMSKDDFVPAENIKKANFNAMGTGEVSAKVLANDVHFRLAPGIEK